MTDSILRLDPQVVLADDNSRFNLKKPRIDELATNIQEMGDVLQPIEVEPIIPPVDGKEYRLTSGFYRHAAVTKLNAEGAGLLLPAIVRITADPVLRLKHQLAENKERENMSPMDDAVAIKRLMDASVPRMEIRRMFARPSNRKGAVTAPASNAWINIMLNLLLLPKSVQEKIHDGRIGVEAAYVLGKAPADKRADIIKRAEAERENQIAMEARDEEKYLEAENKLTAAQEKQKQVGDELEQTKASIKAADVTVKEKLTALREVQKTPYLELDDAGKKALTEKMKAAELELKTAERAKKKVENDLARLIKAQNQAAEQAEETRAKLDAARKAKPKPGVVKKIGVEEVKSAAKKEGVDIGKVPLNLPNIRAAVREVANNKSYASVATIGQLFQDCFDGGLTPKELMSELAVITGEVKRTSKKAEKPAAAATATA